MEALSKASDEKSWTLLYYKMRVGSILKILKDPSTTERLFNNTVAEAVCMTSDCDTIKCFGI